MRGKFFHIVFVVVLLIVVLPNQYKAASNLINDNKEIVVKTVGTINKGIPTEIEFKDDNGKRFNIPISSIPDLEEYLKTGMDLKTELERIQVDSFNWNRGNSHFFILKYGCGNKLCELVLIKITEANEIIAMYLTNGILLDSKVFEDKAMLRIGVNEGNTVMRHQMIIVDLKNLDTFFPMDQNDAKSYFQTPLNPIVEYHWISAKSIELVVADIPDTTFETIEKWNKSTNPPVKRVEIQLRIPKLPEHIQPSIFYAIVTYYICLFLFVFFRIVVFNFAFKNIKRPLSIAYDISLFFITTLWLFYLQLLDFIDILSFISDPFNSPYSSTLLFAGTVYSILIVDFIYNYYSYKKIRSTS